jgi:hypothetical protein
MTRLCPVGHPSGEGLKHCPLCGRKYVRPEQVVLPPTKEEALAQWRANKRAERAAAQVVADIPVARDSPEQAEQLPALPDSSTWTMTEAAAEAPADAPADAPAEDREPVMLQLGVKLLTAAGAATFVGGLVIGETTMAALGWI